MFISALLLENSYQLYFASVKAFLVRQGVKNYSFFLRRILTKTGAKKCQIDKRLNTIPKYLEKRMDSKEKARAVYWLDNNLYLNITNRCSNSCWFCFRNFKQGVGGFNLKLEEEPTPESIIHDLERALALRKWLQRHPSNQG
jgi:hypothetical protein